jgi:hypothetical protein
VANVGVLIMYLDQSVAVQCFELMSARKAPVAKSHCRRGIELIPVGYDVFVRAW